MSWFLFGFFLVRLEVGASSYGHTVLMRCFPRRDDNYLLDVISEEDILQIRGDGVLRHVEIYLADQRRKGDEETGDLKISSVK